MCHQPGHCQLSVPSLMPLWGHFHLCPDPLHRVSWEVAQILWDFPVLVTLSLGGSECANPESVCCCPGAGMGCPLGTGCPWESSPPWKKLSWVCSVPPPPALCLEQSLPTLVTPCSLCDTAVHKHNWPLLKSSTLP